MLLMDWVWSVVLRVILDGRIAQYLADLSKKTSILYEKGRRVLLTATVIYTQNTHLHQLFMVNRCVFNLLDDLKILRAIV